jgi:uncharacterized protein (TIGR03790 family)
VILAPTLALALAQTAPAVLLLRNRNVPEGTAVVAAWRHWREQPDAPEFVVDAPAEEKISRAAFERDIADPLRAHLASEAGAGILWIIPVYGIPLGVVEQPGFDGSRREDVRRNEAAVDSELALLRRERVDHSGWTESPLFDRATPLTRADELLGVSRLDGPTAAIAAALVEKAVLAELFGGVGESFLDTRGLTDETDGYGQRDVFMRSVSASWTRLGLPFAHDDLAPVADLSGRTLLHYQGWYAGDPSAWSGTPRFRTGGIAVHLHSFAALTLRDPRAHWTGPLLAWGATASLGTVFEPYTIGFPYEAVFWDRLAQGWTFGEAAAASSALLSWQAVFVGDPLWRPFGDDAEACAQRRTAFAEALRAWPQTPEAPAFPRFELAHRAFDARLLQIRQAAAGKLREQAWSAFDNLLYLCEGWDFAPALTAALTPTLGAQLLQNFKELERTLARDAADRRALQELNALRSVAAAFGWGARHAALIAACTERQISLVEKALAKRPPLPRSGRILEHWQELRAAEGCTFAPRAPEAAAARLALEADPEVIAPLRAEADKALAKGLREADQLLRRERAAEAQSLLEVLDHDHPDCPAKGELRYLLGQARKAAAAD